MNELAEHPIIPRLDTHITKEFTRKGNKTRDGGKEIEAYKKLFRRYLPLWEQAVKDTELFPEGLIPLPSDVPLPTEQTVWRSNDYFCQTVDMPQVEGSGHLTVPQRLLTEKEKKQQEINGPEKLFEEIRCFEIIYKVSKISCRVKAFLSFFPAM